MSKLPAANPGTSGSWRWNLGVMRIHETAFGMAFMKCPKGSSGLTCELATHLQIIRNNCFKSSYTGFPISVVHD